MPTSIKKLISNDTLVKKINIVIAGVISIEFILKFILALRYKIGWDEFYFLSKIYSYQRGELNEPFQSFHIHLLGWLPLISSNEINQITAARCALFILFLGSGVLFYKISRNFIDRTGALVAILCWISLSNVIYHSCSLRYDSFCSFIFLLACFTLLKEKNHWFWSGIAGIFMGISLLISIKAAVHLVALFGLFSAFFLIFPLKKDILKKLIFFIIFLSLTYGIGFLVHKGTLPPSAISTQRNFFHDSSSKTIIYKHFFPQLGYFSLTLRRNPFTWWLLAVGVFLSISTWLKTRKKNCAIALSFLIPLFSLFFYRNAFPYYYTSIIAPAFLFCGVLPQSIIDDYKKTGSKRLLWFFVIICLPIFGFALPHYFKALDQSNTPQKELFSTIHKMFPDPVPYIDGCSAIASYPKVGFFMSTWGFENYLTTGQPIFHRILQEKHPHFILADTPHLDFDFPRDHPFFEINYDFFEEDKKILEENFVKYWSMVWLPGKTLSFNNSGENKDFEILIPGNYVIESKKQILIDGVLLAPGTKLLLLEGNHVAQALYKKQKTILRWDELKYDPKTSTPPIATFYGF